MSGVTFPTTARKSLPTLARFRNGLYPEAGAHSFIMEEANRLVALRGKQWAFTCPLDNVHVKAGAFLQRWRAFAHTSSHCRYAYVRFLTVPSNDDGSVTSTVTFTVAGDGAPSASVFFQYGATADSDTLDTLEPGQVRTTSDGIAIVDLLPDTDYEISVYDAGNARTAAVCIFEVALQHTTDNGYVTSGVVAGQPILDSHRGDVAPLLRTAWKRNGTPLITWASDVDASSPTRTSATIANLIDGVTGAPTAATAGFTLRLAHRSTIRRAATGIPCIMKVYGSCAGVGNGHVYLTDSSGTDVADVELDSSTEQWFEIAFDLPATDGKYDLRFNGDGVNLLTVRAVSVYQYET